MNITTHGGTTDASDKQPSVVTIGSKDGLGDEMPYSKIMAFMERLLSEPRGTQRAANLIGQLARELAERKDAEGLDYALQEVTQSYRNCFQRLLNDKSPNDKIQP